MDRKIFNAAILVGTALVGGGTAMISVPVGLIATGALIICLTYATLRTLR